MAEAGAQIVWWQQTTQDVQMESALTLHEAMTAREDVDLWVVEGSGLIRSGLATCSILVSRAQGKAPKPSWHELLDLVDIIARSHHRAVEGEGGPESPPWSSHLPVFDFVGGTGEVPDSLFLSAEELLRGRGSV